MEGRPGTKMTGYEIFEDDEIMNLVAFIRSWGK
jgi:cytochrome c2